MRLFLKEIACFWVALAVLGGAQLMHTEVAHAQAADPIKESAPPGIKPSPQPAPEAAPKRAAKRQRRKMERMPEESRDVEGAIRLPKAGVTEIRRGGE
jgi:hypothetical protein